MKLQNASLQYGNRLLWQNLNFAMHTGEFIALIGANGTGKTSLFKAILGIQSLSKGKIIINQNFKIGYVPQLKDFDPKLPIRGRDLVKLGLDGTDYFFGFFHVLFKKNKPYLSTKQKNYLVDKAISEVGGQGFANAPLNMLSGGEQQRMRIAQALVCEPELLLMDEPLLSLDVNSQQIVCDILAHRKQTHQTAILMISHEILPILNLIDTVVYIDHQQAMVGKPMDILPQSSLFQGYFQRLIR